MNSEDSKNTNKQPTARQDFLSRVVKARERMLDFQPKKDASGATMGMGENRIQHKYFSLPTIQKYVVEIEKEFNILSVINAKDGIVTLMDVLSDETVQYAIATHESSFTCVKGDPAQKAGAVNTYRVRYLLMTAYGVVENDTIEEGQYLDDPTETHNEEAKIPNKKTQTNFVDLPGLFRLEALAEKYNIRDTIPNIDSMPLPARYNAYIAHVYRHCERKAQEVGIDCGPYSKVIMNDKESNARHYIILNRLIEDIKTARNKTA